MMQGHAEKGVHCVNVLLPWLQITLSVVKPCMVTVYCSLGMLSMYIMHIHDIECISCILSVTELLQAVLGGACEVYQ